LIVYILISLGKRQNITVKAKLPLCLSTTPCRGINDVEVKLYAF
jgi:hypothetical protein